MSDVGDAGAIITIVGTIIFAIIIGSEILVTNTTHDMRVGMLLLGVVMFLVGGLLMFLTEP